MLITDAPYVLTAGHTRPPAAQEMTLFPVEHRLLDVGGAWQQSALPEREQSGPESFDRERGRVAPGAHGWRHEGLRLLLREEGVSFQVIKTWKQSSDPDFETKKNRVLELYDIADGKSKSKRGDPTVVICMDEFGPLNLLPRPGKQWAPVAVRADAGTKRSRRRRRRATYTRHAGVRHLMAAYDLNEDKIYGHIKTKKDRTTFLEFCRYLRSLYPPEIRIAIVLDNFSPHLSTLRDTRVGDWAGANNVELAYVPTNASWLNRIEAQFQALRYFTLDGTDHRSHEEQNSMIRRYIIWRNRNAHDKTLRELVKRANVA